MHEESQGVDQPAKHQMVAAQQVKGYLRPSTRMEHFSFKVFCDELFNLHNRTYSPVIIPEQREKEVSSNGGVTVRCGLGWRLCGSL